MSWTKERETTLKTMWLDGYSSSQIAKTLGDATRNAVIGRLNRLGLLGTARPKALTGSHVASPKRRGGADTKSVRNRHLNAQVRATAVAEVVAVVPHQMGKAETQRVFMAEVQPTATLVSLGRNACK